MLQNVTSTQQHASSAEPPESDPLTPAAVVRFELGRISNATLHRWIRSGKVPEPAAVVNGRRLWRWSTVLKAREHLIGGAK